MADHGALPPHPVAAMDPSCDTTPASETRELLFVYGSLKRGLGNHHQLAGAVFAGEAWLEGVDLHDLGPFPMAIAGSGRVHGELYRLDPRHLIQLDRFEGAPRLYERQRRTLPDGRSVWIYLGRPAQVRHSPLLRQGVWPILMAAAAVIGALTPAIAHAEASLELCQRWQQSSGLERIRLGNAIGAASYLTKVRYLAESPENAPVALYAEIDLRRSCNLWR